MSESVVAPDATAVASDLDDAVSFLLARANAVSLAAANAALAQTGLKIRSYSVLAMAVGREQASQREIAEYLRLDPSQVVSLVDDLQRRELVERRPDPSDRRANTVMATAAGRELYRRAQRDVGASEEAVLGALSDAQRATLAELLRPIAFPD